jgi:hypothetical protein
VAFRKEKAEFPSGRGLQLPALLVSASLCVLLGSLAACAPAPPSVSQCLQHCSNHVEQFSRHSQRHGKSLAEMI